MPGRQAAELAALDALLQMRKILSGDHKAGVEFAFLAARRSRAFYRGPYVAAIDVLDRSGGRRIVEAVVLDGQMPRLPTALERLRDGLDALHVYFHAAGLL
jgi:hypothetical protein